MSGRPAVRRHSLSTTMVLSFTVLVMVVTMLISSRSYGYTREQLEATASDYTTQLIAQVNSQIDMYVEYIEDLSDFVVRNRAVTAYLQGRGEAAEVASLLGVAAETRSEIAALALVATDGRILFDDPAFRRNPYARYAEAEWYRGALAAPGEVCVTSSRVENLVEGQYPWVISFSQAVTAEDGTLLGVLLADLRYDVIDDICAGVQLGSRGYLFLVDGQGGILWHPQQQIVNAGLKSEPVEQVLRAGGEPVATAGRDGELLYFSQRSPATGWTAVGVTYASELLQQQDRMLRQYLFIDVFAVALALAVAVLLSRAISRPLRQLADTMGAVERGDFSVRSRVRSHSEVGRLSDSFNHMVATISDLMEQQKQAEAQKRQAEWDLLQAQIKPHFLYNTLDSIIWMSHAGHNEEVVEMTRALAQLLRISIDRGSEIVPLRRELDHVESYLTIQKMRYREKLCYELDIEPDTLPCLLPKLVLQPLVENAIYHGIKVKEQGGTVRIASMLDEDKLLLTVEDDGVGMTAEQLAGILDRKPSGEGTSNIGVRNVNERLRLYFGDDCGLKFFSEPGKGTLVMLVLPRILEERGEEEAHGGEG